MQRWHLFVVGHGVLETRLRQLAEDLGLDAQVTFTGRVDDPQSYYRAATLFVLSSRIEGLPNALIEAQVFGVAAVTTDCGGAGDVVDDGQTGRVVPIGDVDTLARNIEELLRESETRGGDGARRRGGWSREVSMSRRWWRRSIGSVEGPCTQAIECVDAVMSPPVHSE